MHIMIFQRGRSSRRRFCVHVFRLRPLCVCVGEFQCVCSVELYVCGVYTCECVSFWTCEIRSRQTTTTAAITGRDGAHAVLKRPGEISRDPFNLYASPRPSTPAIAVCSRIPLQRISFDRLHYTKYTYMDTLYDPPFVVWTFEIYVRALPVHYTRLLYVVCYWRIANYCSDAHSSTYSWSKTNPGAPVKYYYQSSVQTLAVANTPL